MWQKHTDKMHNMRKVVTKHRWTQVGTNEGGKRSKGGCENNKPNDEKLNEN